MRYKNSVLQSSIQKSHMFNLTTLEEYGIRGPWRDKTNAKLFFNVHHYIVTRMHEDNRTDSKAVKQHCKRYIKQHVKDYIEFNDEFYISSQELILLIARDPTLRDTLVAFANYYEAAYYDTACELPQLPDLPKIVHKNDVKADNFLNNLILHGTRSESDKFNFYEQTPENLSIARRRAWLSIFDIAKPFTAGTRNGSVVDTALDIFDSMLFSGEIRALGITTREFLVALVRRKESEFHIIRDEIKSYVKALENEFTKQPLLAACRFFLSGQSRRAYCLDRATMSNRSTVLFHKPHPTVIGGIKVPNMKPSLYMVQQGETEMEQMIPLFERIMNLPEVLKGQYGQWLTLAGFSKLYSLVFKFTPKDQLVPEKEVKTITIGEYNSLIKWTRDNVPFWNGTILNEPIISNGMVTATVDKYYWQWGDDTKKSEKWAANDFQKWKNVGLLIPDFLKDKKLKQQTSNAYIVVYCQMKETEENMQLIIGSFFRQYLNNFQQLFFLYVDDSGNGRLTGFGMRYAQDYSATGNSLGFSTKDCFRCDHDKETNQCIAPKTMSDYPNSITPNSSVNDHMIDMASHGCSAYGRGLHEEIYDEAYKVDTAAVIEKMKSTAAFVAYKVGTPVASIPILYLLHLIAVYEDKEVVSLNYKQSTVIEKAGELMEQLVKRDSSDIKITASPTLKAIQALIDSLGINFDVMTQPSNGGTSSVTCYAAPLVLSIFVPIGKLLKYNTEQIAEKLAWSRLIHCYRSHEPDKHDFKRIEIYHDIAVTKNKYMKAKTYRLLGIHAIQDMRRGLLTSDYNTELLERTNHSTESIRRNHTNNHTCVKNPERTTFILKASTVHEAVLDAHDHAIEEGILPDHACAQIVRYYYMRLISHKILNVKPTKPNSFVRYEALEKTIAALPSDIKEQFEYPEEVITSLEGTVVKYMLQNFKATVHPTVYSQLEQVYKQYPSMNGDKLEETVKLLVDRYNQQQQQQQKEQYLLHVQTQVAPDVWNKLQAILAQYPQMPIPQIQQALNYVQFRQH
jgi:hypothetical protein